MEKGNVYRLLHIVMAVMGFVLLGLVVAIGIDGRNRALFKWNPQYLYLFLALGLIAIAIPVAIMVLGHRHPDRIGIVQLILVVFGLLIALIGSSYLGLLFPHTDKPAQLMLVDKQGEGPAIAVVWYTRDKSRGFVAYGTDPSDLAFVVSDEKPQNEHGLLLEDLKPDTTYWYAIEDNPATSFTYLPDYRGGLRFAIGSDTHIEAGTNDQMATEAMLKQIAEPENDYSLFFNLGDTVEMGNQDNQITRQMELFSPYTSVVPIRSIVGNHDGWFGGANRWKTYRYPDVLPSDSSGAPWYHRFDISDTVHIFMLDLEWGTESYTKAQRTWFERQLEDIDPDDLIIVMNHAYHFASSTEYHGRPWYDNPDMIGTFHDLFRRHGVDVVFSGHDHQMEHISRDGVEYFIVGAFGGAFDKTPTYISQGSRFRDFEHHGFADVAIKDDILSVRLRDQDGTVLYSWNNETE